MLLTDNDKLAIHKRKEGDIWAGLYQLPLVESQVEINNASEINWHVGIDYQLKSLQPIDKSLQHLSHQTIKGQLFEAELKTSSSTIDPEFVWIPFSQIETKGFPKTVFEFIKNLIN